MTDRAPAPTDPTEPPNRPDERTMADVNHTHPFTDETFGGVYRRGPAVADGGPAAGESTDADARAVDQRMKDVDHTPPDEDENDANRVWERGEEAAPSEAEVDEAVPDAADDEDADGR